LLGGRSIALAQTNEAYERQILDARRGRHESLDLGSNELSALPPEIGQLTTLLQRPVSRAVQFSLLEVQANR
jgi:hypothetical protein